VYALSGDVVITGSTLSGNSTSGETAEGGGFASRFGSVLTIVNSTISTNRTNGNTNYGGGGLFVDRRAVTIVNSTITKNISRTGGGIGVNADNNGESLTIQNSIIAGNFALTNPDFTAPGDPGNNLTVISSLIGDNEGTTLAEDQTGVSGSFVGSNSGGGSIDPLLGPLQDNGGPTFTHALLPGSLALESGTTVLAIDPTNGSAALTTDQRGGVFHRLFGNSVDMGAFEDQALLIQGNTAFILGTAGRDSIVFRVAQKQANVNGVNYVLPANITLVQVDGLEGKDTLNLIGTPGAEVVTTGSGLLSVEHNAAHSGVDITGANLEVIILDGQGGNDTVTLNDTAGDDKFFARPTSGFMIDTAGQFETDAFGFQMTGAFTTGNDLAKFFDSAGNDTLTANPTIATIQGTGFLHTAQNFDVLVAQSRRGSDVAHAFGTTGNDAFTGRAGIAVLSSTGFNYQLDGYATINADGLGGTDLVRFLGGPGNDSLTANPTSATFLTGGFTLNTTSFERLIGIAGTGTNDVAILNDSAGNDIFAGTIGTGELAGTGFFERTINFDVIRIRGVNGGTNRRVLNNIAFTLIEEGTWL
ncbi:MAG: hypothetical protein KDA75_02205, partial [Planctomycetaceae bacterium]|nr:hypothetical protein [Planctomycetaceae bacterium]